jgi:hypothetical protein
MHRPQGHHERIAELEQEVKRLTSLQQSSMYLMRRTNSSAPMLAELAATAGMEDSSGSMADGSVPATPMSEGMELGLAAPSIDDDPEFVALASEHMWVPVQHISDAVQAGPGCLAAAAVP